MLMNAKMRWLRPLAMMMVGTACLATARPLAAQKGEAAPQNELRLKVYSVSDLVAPRPDHPYSGALPTVPDPSSVGPVFPGMTGGGIGMGGMGGFGGMGGMGGFGGGGFFQVPEAPASSAKPQALAFQFGAQEMEGDFPAAATAPGRGVHFTIQDLCDAIMETIAPESWDALTGGPATCTPLGGLLLIRQTADAHAQIDALLDLIRTSGGTLRTVTVEAWWLHLDADQLGQLLPAAEDPEKSALVDAAALETLARQVPGHRGRITCFSDQTVHLVSGRRRTVAAGAVPTVGVGAVAYQPSIVYPNIGVLLQVRPSLLPGDEAIMNLKSSVTAWQEPDAPIRLSAEFAPVESGGESGSRVRTAGGQSGAVVDRVNLESHELATTVRLPLGSPVLVGGLTANNQEENEKSGELYLIVRLSASGR